MDKTKQEKRLEWLKDRLSFLRLTDDTDFDDEDWEETQAHAEGRDGEAAPQSSSAGVKTPHQAGHTAGTAPQSGSRGVETPPSHAGQTAGTAPRPAGEAAQPAGGRGAGATSAGPRPLEAPPSHAGQTAGTAPRPAGEAAQPAGGRGAGTSPAGSRPLETPPSHAGQTAGTAPRPAGEAAQQAGTRSAGTSPAGSRPLEAPPSHAGHAAGTAPQAGSGPAETPPAQTARRAEDTSPVASKQGDREDPEVLLARRRRKRRILRIIALLAVVCAVAGFIYYNSLHTFQDYVIVSSEENSVSSGTQYVSAGKYLYRYNSDGISCVTRKNELQWNITYNMQAPIVDVSGTTMVIAEQQGSQVYVVNEDGEVGSFECQLPILKVRVSDQGVVAVVLSDDDVTWVNLYRSDGETIVSDKTTIADSGYPLDVDVSPDGQKMAVSYLCVSGGVLSTQVVFYNFGSEGNSAEDYVVSSESFSETVIPEIYFTGNSEAVAAADDGFVVFRGSTAPEKKAEVWFEEEIVSTFHDDERIGFLFYDDTDGTEYRMELYNYNGKRTALRQIDADFDEIRIQNGQILMYSSNSCSVFTSSGLLRFQSAYEKEITAVFYFKEYRRYLVISKDSFDHIRIC